MKLVEQRQRNDCGVACVAMVANVSYKKAFVALGFNKNTRKFGTNKHNLRTALYALGLDTYPKMRRVPKDITTITNKAILRCNQYRGKDWHWKVYDPKNKTILDPLPKDTSFEWVMHDPSSYLEVL